MLQDDKKLENYSQTVLEHITESVWIVGRDYTLLACNQRFIHNAKHFFGYELTVGGNALGVSDSQETKDFWKNRYDACFAGNSLQEIDTYPPLDLMLRVRFIPMYEGAEIVAAICFSASIKEAKETAYQLINHKKEMSENQHRQARFLAKISHDLRTPLNGIMGLAHLLLHENPTFEQTGHIKKILETTEQLTKITQQALDVIDLSENKILLNEKEFSLPVLLKSIFQAFEPLAKQKEIDFYLEIADTMPNQVSGDDTRITQIIEHLLNNALHFTTKGYIRLTATSQPQEVHNFTTLHISIQDTGAGIAPNKVTEIFEIFQLSQNHQALTGKGLGLLLVKNLVEKLGGQIQVKSKLGEGTTFTCDIPLQIIDTDDHPKHTTFQKTSNLALW